MMLLSEQFAFLRGLDAGMSHKAKEHMLRKQQ